MITEENLDKIVEEFEKDPSVFDRTLASIEDQNIVMFDILLGSHAEILNDDEMDYLVFLYVILYEAISRNYEIKTIDPELVEKMDEASWETINLHNDFESCYDAFYTSIEETELLEFIYVSLDEDEDREYEITASGKLVMLSVLVSEIMLLCEA